MRVFRLCRAEFKALDGEGARLYGGRWNSAGSPAVYASNSLALAALEYLVHVDPADVPSDLTALTIEVPDTVSVEAADLSTLPVDWAQTADCPPCRSIGDAWLGAGVSAVLRVPSAPVREEANFLLNPLHSDASKWKVVEERLFVFDPRLLL